MDIFVEPHIRSRQITRRWSRDTCALEVFALTCFWHKYMGILVLIWIFGLWIYYFKGLFQQHFPSWFRVELISIFHLGHGFQFIMGLRFMDRFTLSLGFMGVIHPNSKLAWAYLLGLGACMVLFIRTLSL